MNYHHTIITSNDDKSMKKKKKTNMWTSFTGKQMKALNLIHNTAIDDISTVDLSHITIDFAQESKLYTCTK